MKRANQGFLHKSIMLFSALILFALKLLLSPICVRIINLTGLKTMRIKNKRFQMPIVFYRNQFTGRKLAFIGTLHIASAGYFLELQQRLDDFSGRGYKIFYEGGPEEKSAKKSEKKSGRRLPEGWAETSSIRHQDDILIHRNHWEDIDISREKFESMLRKRGFVIRRINKNPELQNQHFSRAIVRREINKFYKILMFETVAYRYLTSKIFPFERLKREIIIEYRDQKIVHRVAKSLNENIVLLWGAGHIRGVEKSLIAMGYKIQKTEWVDAFVFEKYSFWNMLKDLNKEMREKISETYIMPYVANIIGKFESKNDSNER